MREFRGAQRALDGEQRWRRCARFRARAALALHLHQLRRLRRAMRVWHCLPTNRSRRFVRFADVRAEIASLIQRHGLVTV